MSKLTDLEAALEAKQEAWAAFISSPVDTDRTDKYRAWESAHGRLHALLTDDTIAALVAVAEAADTFCVCERGGEPISRLSMEAALAPLVKEADHDRA